MLSEKDFVDETPIELDVPGHKGFLYKPLTAGEENDWLPEYVRMDENGKPVYDSGALNVCRLRNLLAVPVKPELITKILNLAEPTEWTQLDKEQRRLFLRKLKPGVFDKIINAIQAYENVGGKKKKDS